MKTAVEVITNVQRVFDFIAVLFQSSLV